MYRRYEELDSLRGIAAMSVFLSHISLVKKIIVFSVLTSFYFPLNMFFDGESSVIFFFILSGFVLFIPYSNGSQNRYGIFIIRRIFRIYIPYLIAIIVSMGACLFFSKGGIKGLSSWFNGSWSDTITLKVLLDHLILIGNFNSNAYNNVIWSLVQEMRISIIFPLIALLVIRFNWKGSLLICLLLSIISGLNNLFHWQTSYGYRTSIFSTFEYISMFMIGSLCAKHLNKLITFYNNLSFAKKSLVCLIAYIAFNYHGIMIMVADYLRIYSYEEIASDYSVSVGSFLIIIIALSSKKVQKFLLIMPLRFLGKVSYSLYLYHLPLLLSLIYIFYKFIPLEFIFVISLPLALLLAYFAWFFIEKPSIKSGKVVASKIKVISTKGSLSTKV